MLNVVNSYVKQIHIVKLIGWDTKQKIYIFEKPLNTYYIHYEFFHWLSFWFFICVYCVRCVCMFVVCNVWFFNFIIDVIDNLSTNLCRVWFCVVDDRLYHSILCAQLLVISAFYMIELCISSYYRML